MKPEITYEDFEKLDLQTAKIIEAENIEGADKLYKLTIQLGKETRTICAGIKEHYNKKDLIGKTIIIIVNLAPRKLKGITSQGMLLAADSNGKPVLLTTESEVKSGKQIS
ncbi:methionine--tRNA ligase subunit beta [Candidatus Pacearchaeota archaeon]|nr:methionine--tRNA ligase subunit beta [Candidatus Pacearchaeota archaeon]|tara:strand:- start:3645 stop:3974 length:330 start_codon:yes stop_codon:yes gene_type:complete